MRTLAKNICLATSVVALSACHPAPSAIHTTPFEADTVMSGIGYSLPKRVLKVALVYTVEQTAETRNGAPLNPDAPVARIVKPIVVTPVLVADASARFVMSGDATAQKGLLDSNLQFNLHDDGLLTGIETDVKDKTAEVIGSLVSAGISAAKIAVAAGSDVPDAIRPVIDRINAIYRELGGMTSAAHGSVNRQGNDPFGAGSLARPATPAAGAPAGNGPSSTPVQPANSEASLARIKSLKAELTELQGVVDAWVKNNTKTVTSKDVDYSTIIDPDDCTVTGNDLTCVIATPNGLITGVKALPDAVVTIIGAKPAKDEATASRTNAQETRGLFHRVPRSLRTTVTIDNKTGHKVEVLSAFVSYPQYGGVEALDLSTKRYAQSKASLTFGSAGGLKTVKLENGSSFDKVAAQAATSLDAIQKSLVDIQYTTKTQVLEAEKKQRDAQKALDAPSEVQAQIDEAKKQKELFDAMTEKEKSRQAYEQQLKK